MSTTTAPTFFKRLFGSGREAPAGASTLTLRYASAADTEAIENLAQLDSRRAPRGAVLVAEVRGEIWAAHSLDDGHTVADPFHPTRALVALLVERGGQLRRAADGLSGAPRVWPQAGYDHPAWN
jgi:hypothetical protein